MRDGISLRATAAWLLLFPVLLLPAGSRQQRSSLALLAGVNLFGAGGSESEYVAGVNDFPRSPAYSAPVMGLRASFHLSPRWAWTIEAHYGFAAEIDRSDPFDPETVRVDSPRVLTAVAGVRRLLCLSRSLAITASLGAGAEYRLAEEKEFISDLGSRIIVGAPARPLSPLLAAGIGLRYEVGAGLAVGAECRAAAALRGPAQWSLAPAVMLELKL